VNVFRRVSSTAQSAAAVSEEGARAGFRPVNVVADAEEDMDAVGVAAMQKGEALFTQKTSRQQAVTPRFGGRLEKLDTGTEGLGEG